MQTYMEVQYDRAHKYGLGDRVLVGGCQAKVASVQGTGFGYGAKYSYGVRFQGTGEVSIVPPSRMARVSGPSQLPDLELPGEGMFDLVYVDEYTNQCDDPMCCGTIIDRKVWVIRDVSTGDFIDFEDDYPDVIVHSFFDGAYRGKSGSGFHEYTDAIEAVHALVDFLSL